MVIDEDVLLENGAEIEKYTAGQIIFPEGALPRFYYQICSGLVKLNSIRDDGSEIIYSLPSAGHCFAETFLWHDVPYCLNAVAIDNTAVLKLPRPNFMQIVNSNISLMKTLMTYTSERMFYRYRMLDILSLNNPSRRVYEVLSFLKSHYKVKEPFKYIVPLTRQQLASITGLRVETVVRTVKKLEKENLLMISKGKICL
ncbi:Crp/Fnr family transcriptional regulator [Chryseobacterium pennipullorum]|uniref:Crp/Fnr family transcriptional regulator n=1 Tax=Chryseobacterium pennipullorum TaxID=2258963 RepID=A0A3D9BA49_9FLAO|nr:Crp/Fnr family transcriptional regulator [Chryseobacterium pennipullorum]REC50218.1 Crp/Fnr family transcriptional regulator [Chryseobacterium pennipullorum]